jgi:hypothetical protein
MEDPHCHWQGARGYHRQAAPSGQERVSTGMSRWMGGVIVDGGLCSRVAVVEQWPPLVVDTSRCLTETVYLSLQEVMRMR